MGIYNISGNTLNACYNMEGNNLSSAYNVSGDDVWAESQSGLKVATYNVGDWGWGDGTISADYKTDYLNLQNTIFTNIDVDICAMQEWSTRFCTDGTLSSVITDKYFDHLDGSGYWAIGSNFAFTSFQTLDYVSIDMSGGSGDYKKYNKAYVTIDGKSICLINCHFATHQATQEAQAAEILSIARQEPYCIVFGDFNTVISSLTDTDYVNMIKPFIDAGFTDANCGAFGILPTYYATNDPSAEYKPATDHIIVSSNITITNAYVDTTKLTDGLTQKIDHVPLVAVLSIN